MDTTREREQERLSHRVRTEMGEVPGSIHGRAVWAHAWALPWASRAATTLHDQTGVGFYCRNCLKLLVRSSLLITRRASMGTAVPPPRHELQIMAPLPRHVLQPRSPSDQRVHQHST